MNANRSFRPDGRWTIQKEAGPSGSHWHEQWHQKQTAVAMPRATCPLPRSLSSLAPSKARHEAHCRSNLRTHVLRHRKTSPQILRPSTPPPETLLPVNCSLSPLSFYLACSSLAQLLALPAAATGSAAGHLPLERGGAGDPTPAADGDASPRPRPEARRAAFIAFLSITRGLSSGLYICMNNNY